MNNKKHSVDIKDQTTGSLDRKWIFILLAYAVLAVIVSIHIIAEI